MKKIKITEINKKHIALISIIFISALLLNASVNIILKDDIKNGIWVK